MLPACVEVGRPIFFSVVIMLLSFLPVFALGGIEGKMFRPLAFTKTFALFTVAVLSITLVPALCTIFLRKAGSAARRTATSSGRVVEVYRPDARLSLLERPDARWPGCSALDVPWSASAPVGNHRPLAPGRALFWPWSASGWTAQTWRGRAGSGLLGFAPGPDRARWLPSRR